MVAGLIVISFQWYSGKSKWYLVILVYAYQVSQFLPVDYISRTNYIH